jgi:hypothetical protein
LVLTAKEIRVILSEAKDPAKASSIDSARKIQSSVLNGDLRILHLQALSGFFIRRRPTQNDIAFSISLFLKPLQPIFHFL